jgi:hypothetical protein
MPWRPSRRLRPPAGPDAIVIPTGNGRLSATDIFALMTDAEPWQPQPGARTPMVFARTAEWVFKSNLTWRGTEGEAVRQRTVQMIELTAALRIWHPDKTWFMLRDRRRYLVCNATPRLVLPKRAGLRYALSFWEMRRLSKAAAAQGFRLDIRMYNFGFDRRWWRLYYLDDEVYRLRE